MHRGFIGDRRARKPSLILVIVAILLLFIPRVVPATAQATPTPTLVVPAGTSWQGYILLEIAPIGPFAGGVTDTMKARLHEAFAMLAREHDNWPPYVLQDTRWRLDNLAVIVEARFISMPSKIALGQLISNRTGYTLAQINNAMSVTVFALGGTWAESRAACTTYLAANRAAWEIELP